MMYKKVIKEYYTPSNAFVMHSTAPSSNGKRADFESVNLGSSPRGASKKGEVIYVASMV